MKRIRISTLQPSLREYSPLMLLLLRLMDGAVVALILKAIVIVYVGHWDDHYTSIAILTFVLTLISFHYTNVYQSWRGQNYLWDFYAIVRGWLIQFSLVIFLLFAFKSTQLFSRVALTVWFLTTPLILFLIHCFIRTVLRYARTRGKNMRNAVIVGAGDLGIALSKYIEDISWTGIRVIGFFDDRKTTADLPDTLQKEKTILGTIGELKSYLDKNPVDFIYIALPMRAEKKIHDILINCRTLGARIFLVPDWYAFEIFNTRLLSLGDFMLLDFNPESDAKRFFDIVFSLLVIIALLPLTLVIALLIKLTDGGPIFYGHRRITMCGNSFNCLKFRTMQVDADKRLEEILKNDSTTRQEWEKTFKLKNDPRVSWLGRILRKTSLDELPQFINVLKGEMSVVGARPIVEQELNTFYRDKGGLYCSIKPGITGLWQVGKRSDTEEYQERVDLDSWYAVNRNFLLDLKIICKTVMCIFKGKGAY